MATAAFDVMPRIRWQGREQKVTHDPKLEDWPRKNGPRVGVIDAATVRTLGADAGDTLQASCPSLPQSDRDCDAVVINDWTASSSAEDCTPPMLMLATAGNTPRVIGDHPVHT